MQDPPTERPSASHQTISGSKSGKTAKRFAAAIKWS